MDETNLKDKTKLEEILNEIENLKKYNNELASHTRGEKLENYINSLGKNIYLLQNKIQDAYDNNYKHNN